MQIKMLQMQQHTPEAMACMGIESTLRKGSPLILGFSAGKDSSVLANLVLGVASKLARIGVKTPIVVTHSDTRVENPEMQQLALRELRKIEAFMAAHDIAGEVLIGKPGLSQSWAVRVIGGRALPPFPDTRRDCTTDWKISVNERNLKLAMKRLTGQGFSEPVVATGVRRDESQERAAAIAARGERSDEPWRNAEGRLMLSPILDWKLDDIWEYLGYCNAGVINSYSDFEETMRVYRDGGGTSCTVVSDMAMAKFAKPCSSRFGCWTCTAVSKDRSLTNMIEQDLDRYGYMQPLADLRNFIAETQYDWDRRQFVQRTINDGYITIAPDTYSPAMCAELLRYALTAQLESGIEIVSEAALVLIDARWSLYGLHPPHEALRIWFDVMRDGNRYYPPKYGDRYRKSPVPVLGKIWVGKQWDESSDPLYVTGLRHPVWEMFNESCGPGLRTFRDGGVGIDVETDVEVDEEAAIDFMDYLAEEKAEEPVTSKTLWVNGYLNYLVIGTVSPRKGQGSMVDELLRRTSWRQRMNLHGSRTQDELYARCDIKFPRQQDMFGLAVEVQETELAMA